MSLACDLIEPLRPHADYWVWTLFRDRIMRPESFQFDQSACRMTKTARGHFYMAYESFAAGARRQLRRYASLLVRQVRSLASSKEEDATGMDWDSDIFEEPDSASCGHLDPE
jgi:CRISPR-associated protein Cas1